MLHTSALRPDDTQEPAGASDPRRRLTRSIFAASALGSTSLFAAFTVGSLVAAKISGSYVWGGVPGASAVFGAAVGSTVLSRQMAIRGRRFGLTLGWGTGLAGALAALVATEAEVLWLLFLGLFMIGIGHASNQQARFAAADMHSSERRAFVLGWVVWAGTIGAVLGPGLLRVAAPLAEDVGLTRLAAGFVIGVVFYAAATGVGISLRPDPGSLAGAEADDVDPDEVPPGLLADLGSRRVRVALSTLVAAQLAMILVMTMAPIHMRDGGTGLGTVGVLMSLHFLGMYAIAPLLGRATDRFGHAPMIGAGGVLLLLATLVAASSSGSDGGRVGLALLLLGLGWSSAFVAGSSLLTGGLPRLRRIRVQGSVDSIVWVSSAIGSLLSGAVMDSVGFDGLSLGAAVVAGVVAVVALAARSPRSVQPMEA